MKKTLKSLIALTMILVISSGLAFAQLDSKALELALTKLASTSQGNRNDAAYALEIYLENDRTIDELKRDLKHLLSDRHIEEIEREGYTLDDMKSQIDILKKLSRTDRDRLVVGVRNGDTRTIRSIIKNVSGGSEGVIVNPPVEVPDQDKKPDDNKLEVLFKDIKGNRYEDEIRKLAEKGIIKGRSKYQFVPDGDITRAEFVSLIDRVMGLEAKNTKLPFKDVKTSAWYYDSVKKAYDNGIIKGKSKTSFEPDSKISREEMSVVVIRVLKEENRIYNINKTNKDILMYADHTSISKWARDGVYEAVRYGLLENRGKKLEPRKYASRAEAARALERVYEAVK